MNITRPILIEADRGKSRRVLTEGIEKATESRASWINDIRPMTIPKGSKINLENVCINSLGVGGDVIELSDRAVDSNHPYKSNYALIELAYYINNNGTNNLLLPYIGQNTRNPPEGGGGDGGGNTGLNITTTHQDKTQGNYGACNGNDFKFSNNGGGADHSLIDNPTILMSRKWRANNERHIKINPSYRGWWDKDTDAYPLMTALTGSIPVELEAGETDPDIIATKITDALHQTNPQSIEDLVIPYGATTNKRDTADFQLRPLQHYNGVACKTIRANGQHYTSTQDKIYSGLFVKNLNRWKMADRWARTIQIDTTHIMGGDSYQHLIYPSIIARTIDTNDLNRKLFRLPYRVLDNPPVVRDYTAGNPWTYNGYFNKVNSFSFYKKLKDGSDLPIINPTTVPVKPDYAVYYTANGADLVDKFNLTLWKQTGEVTFDIYLYSDSVPQFIRQKATYSTVNLRFSFDVGEDAILQTDATLDTASNWLATDIQHPDYHSGNAWSETGSARTWNFNVSNTTFTGSNGDVYQVSYNGDETSGVFTTAYKLPNYTGMDRWIDEADMPWNMKDKRNSGEMYDGSLYDYILEESGGDEDKLYIGTYNEAGTEAFFRWGAQVSVKRWNEGNQWTIDSNIYNDMYNFSINTYYQMAHEIFTFTKESGTIVAGDGNFNYEWKYVQNIGTLVYYYSINANKYTGNWRTAVSQADNRGTWSLNANTGVITQTATTGTGTFNLNCRTSPIPYLEEKYEATTEYTTLNKVSPAVDFYYEFYFKCVFPVVKTEKLYFTNTTIHGGETYRPSTALSGFWVFNTGENKIEAFGKKFTQAGGTNITTLTHFEPDGRCTFQPQGITLTAVRANNTRYTWEAEKGDRNPIEYRKFNFTYTGTEIHTSINVLPWRVFTSLTPPPPSDKYRRFTASTGQQLTQGTYWNDIPELTSTSTGGTPDTSIFWYSATNIHLYNLAPPIPDNVKKWVETPLHFVIYTNENDYWLGALTPTPQMIMAFTHWINGTATTETKLFTPRDPTLVSLVNGLFGGVHITSQNGGARPIAPSGDDVNSFLDIEEDFLLISTMEYSKKNLDLISSTFPSNEYYSGSNDNLTYEQMKEDTNNWYINLDFGKGADEWDKTKDIPTTDTEYSLVPLSIYGADKDKNSISKYSVKAVSPYQISENTLRIKSKYYKDWTTRFKTRGTAGHSTNIEYDPIVFGDYEDVGTTMLVDKDDSDNIPLLDIYNEIENLNIGIYPVKIKQTTGIDKFVMGFLSYRSSITGTGKDRIGQMGDGQNNMRSCWTVYDGNYFGSSTSFVDYPASLPLSNEGLSEVEATGANNPSKYIDDYINNIWIGAGGGGGMLCSFNPSLGRFQFSNFSTPRIYNVKDTGGTAGITGIGDAVVAFNDTNINYKTKVLPRGIGNMIPVNDSISGCYFWGLYWAREGTRPRKPTDDGVIRSSETQWFGSLFYKMGWAYYDLFPRFGLSWSRFNVYDYNKITNEFRYLGVKPFTTNTKLDTSISQDLNILGNNVSTDYAGKPVYGLGYTSQFQKVFTQPQTSELISTNLPSKLEYPYYQVFSSITGNSEYISGEGQLLKCIGYALKNYKSNSWYFSYASNYDSFITNDYHLTSIKTELRTPDGLVVKSSSLGERCVVFYKIIIPVVLPEMNPPEDPELKELKEINEELEEDNEKDNFNSEQILNTLKNIETGTADNSISTGIENLFNKTSTDYKFPSGEILSSASLNNKILTEIFRQHIEAIASRFPLEMRRGEVIFNPKNFPKYLARAIEEGYPFFQKNIQEFNTQLQRATTNKEKNKLLSTIVDRLSTPKITATGKYIPNKKGESDKAGLNIELTSEYAEELYDRLKSKNQSFDDIKQDVIYGIDNGGLTFTNNSDNITKEVLRGISRRGRDPEAIIKLSTKGRTPAQKQELNIKDKGGRGRMGRSVEALIRNKDIYEIRDIKKELQEQLTENLKPSQLEVIERRLKIVNKALSEYRKQVQREGRPIPKERLKQRLLETASRRRTGYKQTSTSPRRRMDARTIEEAESKE